MKRSIDKFNYNEDVTYFLGAFGGCGSFNDVKFNSEVTEVLRTVTYCCARSIKNNEDRTIGKILLDEQQRLNRNISYLQTNYEILYAESAIKCCNDELNFVNLLIENYVIGNLREIITNYLSKTKVIKL